MGFCRNGLSYKRFFYNFYVKENLQICSFYSIGCQVINPNTYVLKPVFARSSAGDFSQKASRAVFCLVEHYAGFRS